MYVTQSVIFVSPVVVFCSAGCARSTPLSMMPMVVPRPSYVGFAAVKAAAPVSPTGMYGLSRGVPFPGAGWGVGLAAPSGDGGSIRRTSSRSTASTAGSAAACLALSMAMSTRT